MADPMQAYTEAMESFRDALIRVGMVAMTVNRTIGFFTWYNARRGQG